MGFIRGDRREEPFAAPNESGSESLSTAPKNMAITAVERQIDHETLDRWARSRVNALHCVPIGEE